MCPLTSSPHLASVFLVIRMYCYTDTMFIHISHIIKHISIPYTTLLRAWSASFLLQSMVGGVKSLLRKKGTRNKQGSRARPMYANTRDFCSPAMFLMSWFK